jgi:hypothetical protein
VSRLEASAISTPVQSRAAIALDLHQFRVENDVAPLTLLTHRTTTDRLLGIVPAPAAPANNIHCCQEWKFPSGRSGANRETPYSM